MSGRNAVQAIVFADIVRSTQLFEKFGDVRAQRLVGFALEVLTDVANRHGGTLIKTIGDEVLVTFDDLTDALKAVCQMPAAVREEPSLAAVGMMIKVGLHYGEVVLRDDDVFGDAVNVAARMKALAKADQILTTRHTADSLPPEAPFALRSIGPIKVRGKQDPIDVVEVLWQPDADERTMLGVPAFVPRTQARLVLRYGEARLDISQDQLPFLLGRDERSDLVVDHQLVSRVHARIEFGSNQFILIDASTNGTYLEKADETIFLHREQSPLTDQGVIGLGQDPATADAEAVIRFACVS